MNYYVRHRTYQETSWSGYRPPDMPWKYDGPFTTYAEAKAHWEAILYSNSWSEGAVMTKCQHCNQYGPTSKDGRTSNT